eukprot:15484725-Alexandrium_andersonii.AAC.1
MLVKSGQLGLSRCAGCATMADSPSGQGADPIPQRLTGAPSEPSPNGHRTMGEDAFTQQLGAPQSGAPSRA